MPTRRPGDQETRRQRTTMTLTRNDKLQLGRLTTRDEAGRHFADIYPDEWLDRMEVAGLITIDRPIHKPTGIPYSREYWSVQVADEVADWFDSYGQLY